MCGGFFLGVGWGSGVISYLNSGKLRIMTSRHAFIPENSTNLVDPLKPSNLYFVNGNKEGAEAE